MATTDRCPDCGAERRAGLCLRCLIRLGLDGSSLGPGGASDFAPPSLQAITAAIGPLPQVLLRDTETVTGPGPVVQPSSAEMPAPADRSTHLQLLGEIARGGMGAVFKGRDPDLGRDLAVKVLLESHKDKPELVRRFVEEAQIAGQLQHPGVVPVYELGAFADRRPYFAMKLVKGHTLASMLAERDGSAADLPGILSIFEAVCQTVAYAHARGVIHRDLKPSNVMVGSFGEVQVMDWGLAKVLPAGGVADEGRPSPAPQDTVIATARSGSDADQSVAGSIMGTLTYMAPEQARGEVCTVDERADVFALGSVLCEVLTGRPAFTGRDQGEVQAKSARGDVADALARLGACGADAGLVALARDCLAPERDDRPRDAGAVAARVTAHLAGVQERLRAAELARVEAQARAEEESKRRVLADRLSLEERRKRRVSLALAASVLLTAALAGGGWVWVERGRAARRAAIDTALAEARRLHVQARQAPPEDRARWAEAVAVVQRAEGLLAGADEPAWARRVDELKGQIEADRQAAEAERKLLADLEAVRGNRAENYDAKQADREYAEAFRAFGLDLDATDPKQAAAKLAGRPSTAEVAAAIDEWCRVRRIDLNVPSWQHLAEVARAADPDPWRNALRDQYGRPVAESLESVKARAADAAALARQPAANLVLLADMLLRAGDRDGSAAVLRAAWRRFPGDFWVNNGLGHSSWAGDIGGRFERPDEAIRYFTAAVAARPGSFMAFNSLGIALHNKGDQDGAIAAYREALRLKPDLAPAHNNLGVVLQTKGDRDGAVAAYREAIRLKPDFALFHYNLGNILRSLEKLDEAIDEYSTAVRLRPDYSAAQNNLVSILKTRGQLDPAIAAYREVVRRKPDDATALTNLAKALLDNRQPEEAITVCREAIRRKPDFAEAYSYLGAALNRVGRRTEAIAAWREAVRLNPKAGWTWYWLGPTQLVAGDFAGAADALRHAIDLLGPAVPADAAKFLARAELYTRLEGRLPAVAKGEDKPKDPAEAIHFARMCYDRMRYAASARLFAAAYAADPKLADDEDAGRFYAARAAALGGCGPGKDDPPPDEAARAGLRKQALAWLRERLAQGQAVLGPDGADPQKPDAARAAVVRKVRQEIESCKTHRDLTGVRDPDALAKLPEAEQAEWRAFWADADALLRKVGGAPAR
jgi:serine/threonine-protein kinase